MAKLALIEVDRCDRCPHVDRMSANSIFCTLIQRRKPEQKVLVFSSSDPIPEWCPLQTAEEFVSDCVDRMASKLRGILERNFGYAVVDSGWSAKVMGRLVGEDMALKVALEEVAKYFPEPASSDVDRIHSAFQNLNGIRQIGYFEGPNWEVRRSDRASEA